MRSAKVLQLFAALKSFTKLSGTYMIALSAPLKALVLFNVATAVTFRRITAISAEQFEKTFAPRNVGKPNSTVTRDDAPLNEYPLTYVQAGKTALVSDEQSRNALVSILVTAVNLAVSRLSQP